MCFNQTDSAPPLQRSSPPPGYILDALESETLSCPRSRSEQNQHSSLQSTTQADTMVKQFANKKYKLDNQEKFEEYMTALGELARCRTRVIVLIRLQE